VIFLVPHSSHQTQPLDILTFALLDQRFSNSKFERLANAQSNKIVKMLGARFVASAPHDNVEGFMGIGLIPRADGEHYYLEVHPDKARRVQLSGLERGEEIPPAPLPADVFVRIRLPTGLQMPEYIPNSTHRGD
jgi:hypothetical protein